MTAAVKIRGALLGDRYPLATIVVISLLIELAWFSIQNVGFHCDSPGYIQYAQGMFGKPWPYTVLWARTVSYPLLIILSGVLWPDGSFHSFLGILLLQAVMAVGIPVLVYKIIEPYQKRVAFFTAIVMIASLQPFITSKLVMNEQAFKFFVLLLIYFACGAYRAEAPRWWIAGLGTTVIFLALLRPAAILMALVVFGALLLARPKTWKMLAAASAALAATMFVYSFAVCLLLPPIGLYKPTETPRFYDLAFYDLYMTDGASALDPEKGPQRRKLREILDAFATDLPPGWVGRFPARYFGHYAKDPKAWVDQLYREPNRYKYLLLKDAVPIYRDMGPNLSVRANTSRIIPRVVREVYLREPWRLVGMIFRYGTSLPGGGLPQIMFNRLFSENQLAKFSPDNGPASREFIEKVKEFYRDYPTELAKLVTPPDNKSFVNDVDGFVRERLLGVPSPYIFYHTWIVLEQSMDPFRSRQLYADVVHEGFEHATRGKWNAYIALAHQGLIQLQRFFFQPYFLPQFDFFHSFVFCYQNTSEPQSAYESELLGGLRLVDWVKIEPNKIVGYRNWFDYLFHAIWMITHLGTAVFVILGAPFAFFSRCRWPILITAAIILAHAVPSCFFVFAQTRYIDQTLPVAILLCGFVAAGLVEVFIRCRALKFSDKAGTAGG